MGRSYLETERGGIWVLKGPRNCTCFCSSKAKSGPNFSLACGQMLDLPWAKHIAHLKCFHLNPHDLPTPPNHPPSPPNSQTWSIRTSTIAPNLSTTQSIKIVIANSNEFCRKVAS